MSEPSPTGPIKKEANAAIVAATISGIAAVLAASVPIVTNALKPPAAPSTGASSAAISASEGIGTNNLADKSAHYITLSPYDVSGGDSYTALENAYFRSPKDSKKWIKLTITQHNHNQVVTLSGTDFDSQSKTTDISANDAQDDQRYEVKTRNFTIHANVRNAETGPDPDKTAPLAGKVFQKLELRLDCDDHS